MDINALKQAAYEIAEKNIELYNHVCDEIFKHPELGNQEVYSSQFLTQEMEKRGFRVQFPYGGLDTAFRCEVGEGHPKVAFLAEYDALPGYGPNKDQNGHACGHNWIAACTFGAADVLAQLKEHFKGTIVYIGTPAEEGTGGKVDLVNNGCFDDIDVAFQMHLSSNHGTELNNRTLAIDSLEFTFEGVAAHAAGNPWRGVNALDAAYLMFNGVNALRQHVTPDARIHGIIEEGGVAPNIVPSHSCVKFMVRAADRQYLNELTQKVINCAKGAELMTGAKMTYRNYENSYDDLHCDPTLIGLMSKNLTALGVEHNTDEQEPAGSSDLGNVSKVCPTCYVSMDVGNTDGSSCHEEMFLQHVNSALAYDKNLKAVKAMAATAIDVLLDENVQKALKK